MDHHEGQKGENRQVKLVKFQVERFGYKVKRVGG
jgi:hypothetical protein